MLHTLRIKNKFDILIDFGPNHRVLDCLGKHMPFYDRKIELTILTHPDSDHYGGFVDVANHYQIVQFITNSLNNKQSTFIKLKKTLLDKKIKIVFVFADQFLNIFNDSLDFY